MAAQKDIPVGDHHECHFVGCDHPYGQAPDLTLSAFTLENEDPASAVYRQSALLTP